eukprot:NODE_417_length_8973_cov_0.852941.p7 type:complete len:100 gc:universal NODE_417_length_8973_cov_0.852941:3691-3392(-)
MLFVSIMLYAVPTLNTPDESASVNSEQNQPPVGSVRDWLRRKLETTTVSKASPNTSDSSDTDDSPNTDGLPNADVFLYDSDESDCYARSDFSQCDVMID